MSLASGQSLDAETATGYVLTITASESDGAGTDTATVTITATPVAPNTFTTTQGFGNPVTRTIGLRTGSRPYVD